MHFLLSLKNCRHHLFAAVFIVMALAMSLQVRGEVSQLQMELNSLDGLFGDYNEIKQNVWENWQLEKDEWDRYQTIIDTTPWGIWKHEATPYQLLAAYASTIEEKRRYARMEAKLDQWREHTALSFQQIYNDERELVFAKYSSVVRNLAPVIENVGPGNKIAVFANDTKCLARCIGVMNRLLKTGANLDIYLLNTKVEDEVYKWAADADIPIDRVHTNQITLNFDEGYFNRISSTPMFITEFPVAFVLKNDTWEKLAL